MKPSPKRNLYELVRSWMQREEGRAYSLKATAMEMVRLEDSRYTQGLLAYARHLQAAIKQLIAGIPAGWESLEITGEMADKMEGVKRRQKKLARRPGDLQRSIRRVNAAIAAEKERAGKT